MIIKKTTIKDADALLNLYLSVSENKKGIARVKEEISKQYVIDIITNAENGGLMFVGFDNGKLIAEIHALTYGIKIFDHILTNLTIVIHPYYQSQGYGKQLFQAFLSHIEYHRPDILRVELESRSSNEKSLKLYKSLGFKQEGTMINKTRNVDGDYENSLLFAWFNKKFIS